MILDSLRLGLRPGSRNSGKGVQMCKGGGFRFAVGGGGALL